MPNETLDRLRETTRLTGPVYREAVEAVIGQDPEAAKRMMRIFYATIGLSSEAGEVCNKIKKLLRDCGGALPPDKVEEIVGELGGVCWYLDALADELGMSLESIMEYNVKQIRDRHARGTIQGSGDNR